MTDAEKREKIIKGLECCEKKVCIFKDTEKECPYWELCGEYEGAFEDCTTALAKDALALLKEYDEALKLMVYQYCTMKPLTVHDEVFHNKFMSAGEAAFRLLGLENGQSTDGVWERWFPNG